ncbi:MAG: hypothetical protein M3O50_17900 [Myxococcota bacterium]|nr:hypothetical protein [Myxococcota bacterium]
MQSRIAPGSAWNGNECLGPSASALCAQLKRDVDINRTYRTVSIASYVGAGVLGAASLATWMLWKPKAGAVTAHPMLSAQSGGVVVNGCW